ncbi:hypothetical protein HZA86_03530 [Candidatus Uhrbacteria bacterium]|nr:hypothetical protein [Candidatus Uhrbacteria bacterium]
MWSLRTDWALQTPWVAVTIPFFLALGISTALLLFAAQQKSSYLTLVGMTAHWALLYGVALIAFRYGYGYDPIIHQAAERTVAEHGSIQPFQPFYIGQYSIVGALHALTRIPTDFIDRMLVPVFAITTLPTIIWYGLVRGYKIPSHAAALAVLALPIIPLSDLTYTVPYTLTVLYAIWFVFLLPVSIDSPLARWTIAMIAIAAVVTHPLLGVPLLLLSLCVLISARIKQQKLLSLLLFFAIPTTLIGMFGIFRLLHEQSFFAPWSISDFWTNAIVVFSMPYPFSEVAWYWKFLYQYEHYGLLIGLIIMGVIALMKTKNGHDQRPLLALVAGMLVTVVLLPTLIAIPGVVEYEQYEFVLRLRDSIVLFLLPILLVNIGMLLQKTRSMLVRWAIIGAMGILTSIGFYLTYPQINPVVQASGWNMGRHDIDAVQAIEDDARGNRFVVIADQLLSAVALRERGFDQTLPTPQQGGIYPYAISPSEFLFPYREEILYSQLRPDVVTGLFEYLDLEYVYVAVHEYWYRVDAIEQEIIDASGEIMVGPAGVRLYRFQRAPR